MTKWLQKEAGEREWEAYLDQRDENSSRLRSWRTLQWELGREINKAAGGERASRQGKLNRILWALDLAPTGQRKVQRGYEGDHGCECREKLHPENTY